jgi:hypothetical protein
MNRKIIVSGCANCPYLTVWNDGEGNGINSISSGDCRHPSFNKECSPPRFPPTVFFQYTEENVDGERLNYSNVFGTKPAGIPDWCPLPNDKP